jgi:PAS domain S-box-containing protein
MVAIVALNHESNGMAMGGELCTLQSLPLCMVTLDAHDLKPTAINDTFFRVIGPLYKFRDSSFVHATSDDKASDAKERLQQALDKALTDTTGERVRVRNIEMTTLTGDTGFPVRRFFDWFISLNDTGDSLTLLGDPCTDHDVEQREKDSELIDFFQNAPIAMHWLSGEGKVMWANQTELNVLGYTPEEYIGQDIMKFCPDEQELVLEIFKQLGSGNTIKDVPVRFRTKDGKIVYLLIDSNVRYEKDGSFGHTRCFIRDDTGRKIREARTTLLLEETKRSLNMLDNFMSRSLHHLRTPLHVTQSMVDAIAQFFVKQTTVDVTSTAECMELVRCKEMLKRAPIITVCVLTVWFFPLPLEITMAADQIAQSMGLLNDVADLAKFDQGGVLHIQPELISLESFGKKLLNEMPPTRPGVDAVLELCTKELSGAGPSMAATDPKVLRRVLLHLLNNAVHLTESGSVKLGIGYKNSRLTFSVTDTGPGLEMPDDAAEGDLPLIFQRYHKEFVPEEAINLTMASNLRDKIEEEINTHTKNGLGIGLSLTYHLVQSLGGELRCTSSKGQGARFYFSLARNATYNTSVPLTPSLVTVTITRSVAAPRVASAAMLLRGDNDKSTPDAIDDDTCSMSHSGYSTSSIGESHGYSQRKSDRSDIPSSFEMPTEVVPQVLPHSLASEGVKCADPPSILVVEDTATCAKMLCRLLTQIKCATKWAKDGKEAVDILREATPGTYDLVLMDLRMPVMDGFEATKIIKGELGLTIPVVALTGDENEETRKLGAEIGFDDFHGKPMKRDKILAVVKKFTGYEVKR